MTKSVVRRAIAASVLSAAAVVGTWSNVGEAHAATGHVYISFPTWQGNCPAGGSVRAINGSVTGTTQVYSWELRNWDVGDDLIYPKVLLNKPNRASVGVWCGKNASSRPGVLARASHAVSVVVTPKRNNQTIWVGPRGVRY